MFLFFILSKKVTVNPGAQGKVGSFNPITEGDWTFGAYITSSNEKFVQAINKNDLKTVTYCVEKEGCDIESRDGIGRTGLHIAGFFFNFFFSFFFFFFFFFFF